MRSAALADYWGYQQFFPYLITDPRVSVEIDGEPGALMVEKVNTDVSKTAGFTYAPYEVEASFFASTQPAVEPARPPLDSFFYGGEGTWLAYRATPAAVDISETPIHLGRMHLYSDGRSGDKPGYYATVGDGLGFTVRDRAGSEAIRVDLAAWLTANPTEGSANYQHYMTDPVVRFILRGKSHALVLESIAVKRHEEGGGELDFMTDQLFRAP